MIGSKASYKFRGGAELSGKGPQIKESIVGVEVFGRGPDYDVRADSVVRTEAAKLRKRLAEYYAKEGSEDAVLLDRPKGGYLPFSPPATSGKRPGRGIVELRAGPTVTAWIFVLSEPPAIKTFPSLSSIAE